MRVLNIKLGEDELPEEVTVTMTTQEAAWITKRAGRIRGVGPWNEVWEALTGSLFSRFWMDGVNEVAVPEEWHPEQSG